MAESAGDSKLKQLLERNIILLIKNHNNEDRRVRVYERETEKERGIEMGDRKVKR